MYDIIVIRGSGVSQGDDIVDPLLTSTIACMERGRVELDDGSGLHSVEAECVYRDGLMLAEIAEMYYPLRGSVGYGKITSITHNIKGAKVETTLIVDTPSEFVV